MQRPRLHLCRLLALAAVLAAASVAAPPAAAQTAMQDCAVIEGMFDSASVPVPWPRGGCCDNSRNFACVGGRVTQINLCCAGLNGVAIPDLSGLTQLEFLGLSNNSLAGPIPDSIGTLTLLRYLILNDNRLSGAIPPSLASLARLQVLQIQNNNLTGRVDNILPSTLTLCILNSNRSNTGLYTCGGVGVPFACWNNANNDRLPVNATGCPVTPGGGAIVPTGPSVGSSNVAAVAGGVIGGAAALVAVWLLVRRARRNDAAASKREMGALVQEKKTTAAGGGRVGEGTSAHPGVGGSATVADAAAPKEARAETTEGRTCPSPASTSEPILPPPPSTTAIPLPSTAMDSFSPAEPLLCPERVTPHPIQASLELASGPPSGAYTDSLAVLLESSTAPVSGVTLAYRSVDVADLPDLAPSKVASGAVEAAELQTQVSEHHGVPSESFTAQTLAQSEAPHWAYMAIVGPLLAEYPKIDVPKGAQALEVVYDYDPVGPDELCVRRGQLVKLKTVFRDGWGLGLDFTNEVYGLLPLECLRISADQPVFGGASVRLESMAAHRTHPAAPPLRASLLPASGIATAPPRVSSAAVGEIGRTADVKGPRST